MSIPLLFLPKQWQQLYVLLRLSLYSRHIYWEDSSLFPPQRSATKICTNKTNIYASAEICSPTSPLHEHTGRLLTGPQITQEVSTAVGCGDLAGFLITLGQTETWNKAPFARGIALNHLLWNNKVGRLLKRPGRLWWQFIQLMLKIQKHRSLLLPCGLSQLSDLCSEMWGAWSPATVAQLLVQHWMGEV